MEEGVRMECLEQPGESNCTNDRKIESRTVTLRKGGRGGTVAMKLNPARSRYNTNRREKRTKQQNALQVLMYVGVGYYFTHAHTPL